MLSFAVNSLTKSVLLVALTVGNYDKQDNEEFKERIKELEKSKLDKEGDK